MSRFFLLKQLPPSLQWLGDTHTHEASERPSKTFCVCWQTETWEGWKWLKLSAVGKCVTSYLILEGPPQKRFLTFQINCDSRGGNELTNGKKCCEEKLSQTTHHGATRGGTKEVSRRRHALRPRTVCSPPPPMPLPPPTQLCLPCRGE